MFNYFIFQHRARKYEEKYRERADVYLYDEDFERICRSNTVIAKDDEVVALLLYIFIVNLNIIFNFQTEDILRLIEKYTRKLKLMKNAIQIYLI